MAFLLRFNITVKDRTGVNFGGRVLILFSIQGIVQKGIQKADETSLLLISSSVDEQLFFGLLQVTS